MDERGLEPERLERVELALGTAGDGLSTSFCGAVAEFVGVQSAGVVLMSRGRVLGRLCASDHGIEGVEDLEYTLGQGPCVDAYRTTTPVMVPDLTAMDASRWPQFSHGALAVGMHAAFGFPLLAGSVCLGALNLYNRQSGALTGEQFSDAVAVAHVAARSVLAWQADVMPGGLAEQLDRVPLHLAVVHQATGKVSVQAGVSVDDAQVLLRAYAFAEDRPIQGVARDVVDGTLSLE